MTSCRGQSGRYGEPSVQGGAAPSSLGKFAGGSAGAPGLGYLHGRPVRCAPSPHTRPRCPQRCPGLQGAGVGPDGASPPHLSSGAAAVTWAGSKEKENSNSKEKNVNSVPRAGAGGSYKPALCPGLPVLGHQPPAFIPPLGAVVLLSPGLSLSFLLAAVIRAATTPSPAFPERRVSPGLPPQLMFPAWWPPSSPRR